MVFTPMCLDGLVFELSDVSGRALTVEETVEDVEARANEDPLDVDGLTRCAGKLRLCTYMFHVFVFLNLFNLINSRKDGVKDFNVFSKPFHNWFFIAVFIGEFTFQIVCPAKLMRTSVLGVREFGACISMGTTTLIISALLKCTPVRWTKKLDNGPCGLVDESKAVKNRLTDCFTKMNEI
jgi:hypothetical protein